jgi:hypothetical protein
MIRVTRKTEVTQEMLDELYRRALEKALEGWSFYYSLAQVGVKDTGLVGILVAMDPRLNEIKELCRKSGRINKSPMSILAER